MTIIICKICTQLVIPRQREQAGGAQWAVLEAFWPSFCFQIQLVQLQLLLQLAETAAAAAAAEAEGRRGVAKHKHSGELKN